ncbi:hypothetical protein [Sebaldella sp. S0638]|uniref:hypothetical protein n=1 Tax=Sebaldella sp. S0638 TaxID=2957809 RepID=UPI0020A07755|nr:hypothetical protein [Sebaldella sp. S0638]MCP1224900.1 hypothetical protein [Sebaldella sp. S0638]
MKKTLVMLFLLLTVTAFSKNYYGKEVPIATVYSQMNLKRPALKNQTAQGIVDEFTRITYESVEDYSTTPEKDYGKLDDYYMARTNAVLDKLDKNMNSLSEADAQQILDHLDKLQAIVDQLQ